jgi:hypothetical protein
MERGEPISPRKHLKDASNRFIPTPERQQQVAKVLAEMKHDMATTRPRVRKSLYSNIYAAMGTEPARPKKKKLKDTGTPFDDLLVFMLRHIRLDDGTTFDIEAATEVNYIICQVSYAC